MRKITENFCWEEMTRSESGTRHGISNEPATAEIKGNIVHTAHELQKLRTALNKPIRVFSCYRSREVNKLVGGSLTSAHMLGLAADIYCPELSNAELANFIAARFEYDQIILEFPPGGWVHWGIKPVAGRCRSQQLTALKRNGKTCYENGFNECIT